MENELTARQEAETYEQKEMRFWDAVLFDRLNRPAGPDISSCIEFADKALAARRASFPKGKA